MALCPRPVWPAGSCSNKRNKSRIGVNWSEFEWWRNSMIYKPPMGSAAMYPCLGQLQLLQQCEVLCNLPFRWRPMQSGPEISHRQPTFSSQRDISGRRKPCHVMFSARARSTQPRTQQTCTCFSIWSFKTIARKMHSNNIAWAWKASRAPLPRPNAATIPWLDSLTRGGHQLPRRRSWASSSVQAIP